MPIVAVLPYKCSDLEGDFTSIDEMHSVQCIYAICAMNVEYIIDRFLLSMCQKKRNELGYDIFKGFVGKEYFFMEW